MELPKRCVSPYRTDLSCSIKRIFIRLLLWLAPFPPKPIEYNWTEKPILFYLSIMTSTANLTTFPLMINPFWGL